MKMWHSESKAFWVDYVDCSDPKASNPWIKSRISHENCRSIAAQGDYIQEISYCFSGEGVNDSS